MHQLQGITEEISGMVKMSCIGIDVAVTLYIKVVKMYQDILLKCKLHTVCQLYWNKFDFKIKS